MQMSSFSLQVTPRSRPRASGIHIVAAMTAGMVWLGTTSVAIADEADAKSLFKAMSDYLAAQKSLSFDYDVNFEIVTKDQQKLALASSGTVTLSRPDKIHATRSTGFADVEMNFDGKVLTLLGKNANLYAQIEVPGTLDNLLDELRDRYNKPFPGADLLLSNVNDVLMPDVVDAKDLGSGVIGGVECDHLAFRTKDVDWQIWIAQGESPYPCRLVITTKLVATAPQYSVQIRNWKSDTEVALQDFGFQNSTSARKVNPRELRESDELPSHFTAGDAQ